MLIFKHFEQVFQLLEQHEELRLCEEGQAKFNKELKYYSDHIYRFIRFNASEGENIYSMPNEHSLSSPNFTYLQETQLADLDIDKYYLIDSYLNELSNTINEIKSETGYGGQNCSRDTKWTFGSSLLSVSFLKYFNNFKIIFNFFYSKIYSHHHVLGGLWFYKSNHLGRPACLHLLFPHRNTVFLAHPHQFERQFRRHFLVFVWQIERAQSDHQMYEGEAAATKACQTKFKSPPVHVNLQVELESGRLDKSK